MKQRNILLINLAVVLFQFLSCSLNLTGNKPESQPITDRVTIQNVNTEEDTGYIYNPDQGFYRPIVLIANENGITSNGWYGKDLGKLINAYPDIHLYHLRFDISTFSGKINGSGDKELTEAVLEDFRKILELFREKELNVIIRFTYCPKFGWTEGSSDYTTKNFHDFEAEEAYIIKHIKSISSVANDYGDVITAIETGLVGGWGEMHGTVSAETPDLVATIINEYLLQTRKGGIPILVRTPDRIYSYIYKYRLNKELKKTQTKETIGFEVVSNYSTDGDEILSRLGLYNDGYLGSETDLGTYKTNRTSEVDWLCMNITNSTPYGGEVVGPEAEYYKLTNEKKFNTLDEMFKMNLSYLNIEWNNNIIEKWQKTSFTAKNDKGYNDKTDFDYIKNHLGYRFILEESKFSVSSDGKLRSELKIKNIGFGNLNREKKVSILFVKDGVIEEEYKNICVFRGEETLNIECNIPKNIKPIENSESGYTVYIRLDDGNGKYTLQFANKDIWNAEFTANRIGNNV